MASLCYLSSMFNENPADPQYDLYLVTNSTKNPMRRPSDPIANTMIIFDALQIDNRLTYSFMVLTSITIQLNNSDTLLP